MSLVAIVKALGGELYAGGRAASVPGPGHSRADRSVSLLLVDGRVVVNSFAGQDWRLVMAELQRRGLVDRGGRLANASGCEPAAAPTRVERIAVARSLWAASGDIHGGPAEAYCRRRRIHGPLSPELRFHPAVAAAVYRDAGTRRPGLLAALRDGEGGLCGVELTYLTWRGERAPVAAPRKTIGTCPPGTAVRLSPPARRLVVAEGVFTALSAAEAFGGPAWALLSAGNLERWSPPPEVRQVLIAADRGEAGERAATSLAMRLRRQDRGAEIRLPPVGFGDWNEAAAATDGRREEGRGGAGAEDGWSGAPPRETSS